VFTLTLTRSILMTEEPSELDGLHRLESQAVAAVYDRYFPEVYRYVRYRLGDEILAEDIASDVFMRLLEAERRRRGPDKNLRGWLIGTANHMVNDHLRHKYRRPQVQLDEAHASSGPALGDEVENQDRTRFLQSALTRLTTEQQHVLALRFSQNYSLEETAAVMKKNVNAIKQLQYRALAALIRQMAKYT
jgi:RNA polymerase sigma-70 factor (ECF subfamily)